MEWFKGFRFLRFLRRLPEGEIREFQGWPEPDVIIRALRVGHVAPGWPERNVQSALMVYRINADLEQQALVFASEEDHLNTATHLPTGFAPQPGLAALHPYYPSLESWHEMQKLVRQLMDEEFRVDDDTAHKEQ
jgi:hypothetical protein